MAAESDPRVLIEYLVEVRRRLAAVDVDGIYEYDRPRAAASEAAVRDAEHRLGLRLPPSHRAFLLAADGWPNFFQDQSLFSADELGGDSAFQRQVRERLDFYRPVLGSLDLTPDDVVAIGSSSESADVLALVRPGHAREGQVIWLPGDPIELWEHFEAAMMAFIAYTEEELADFLADERLVGGHEDENARPLTDGL